MQTWVSVTSRAFNTDGATLVLNADLIETVGPHELGSCIYMASGKLVVVKETMKDVFDNILEANGMLLEESPQG